MAVCDAVHSYGISGVTLIELTVNAMYIACMYIKVCITAYMLSCLSICEYESYNHIVIYTVDMDIITLLIKHRQCPAIK